MDITLPSALGVELAGAIKEFSSHAAFGISDDGLALRLSEGSGFCVVKDARELKIEYTRRCEIFRGLAMAASSRRTAFAYRGKARFKTLSLMADNSRNAVMNITALKRLVRTLASLGYNELQLYTEDTLEIENQPYFGHMRGRFAPAEIKEADGYCRLFGIELVPCVQTLAHLNAAFKWPAYRQLNDCEDILLLRSERTYAFIDDLIRSVSKNFGSRKVNIGMDEAFLTGAGRFFEKYGHVPRRELISEHLGRVAEICIKYGMAPMVWSDMFFRPYNKGEYHLPPDDPFEITSEIARTVPDGVELIYWDYYSADPARYRRMFERHKGFHNNIRFAGGAWKWSGFVPFNSDGLERARAAAAALVGSGINDVMVTAWGDNGAECPLFSVLPQLIFYSELNYSDDLSDAALERASNVFCGVRHEDFMALELPDRLYPELRHSNISKCLYYNDPLLGLCDHYVKEDFVEKLGEYSVRLAAAGRRNPEYEYIFAMAAGFALALSAKCELGVLMKDAYDSRDTAKLRDICKNRIPAALRANARFEKLFRKYWQTENKPFGREVMDIRIAGVSARLKAAGDRLKEFLERHVDVIEELEQPRLPVDPEDGGTLYRHFWHDIASPSIFTKLN